MDVQHIDVEALEELKDIMEDEFECLIHTFIVDSEKKIMALRASVESEDAMLLSRVGHSFKGSSSNIGAVYLAQLCQKAEDQGRNNDWSDINDVLQTIKDEFHTVKATLNDLI